MVEKVYPVELLDLFPDSNVDRTTARNWFMSQGVGQAAADKMAALFIMLKSGEIREKKVNPSKKASNINEKKNDRQVAIAKEKMDLSNMPANFPVNETNQLSCPGLHIDLQIHISPESTPEQIEIIFASIAKHLYGANSK